MSERFGVGDQVVCVCPGYDGANYHKNRIPVTGAIYTVRGFFRDQVDGALGIWLEEIVNPKVPVLPDARMDEIGWDAEHFRPCKKTDISALTRIKAPEPTTA